MSAAKATLRCVSDEEAPHAYNFLAGYFEAALNEPGASISKRTIRRGFEAAEQHARKRVAAEKSTPEQESPPC